MDEAHKELVKRLRERTVLVNYGNGTFDAVPNRDCNDAADALEALAGEVETLRMKLAACGVGALSNTERTIKDNRIGPDSPYWSASLGDVYQIVDKEMEARAERDRLKAALDALSEVRGDLPEKVSEQWLYEGVRHWHRNCDWDDPLDGSPLDRGDGATVAKILNMIPRKALGDAS